METHNQFQDILKRYITGQITDAERALVDQWYLARRAQNQPFDLDDADLQEDLSSCWQSITSQANIHPDKYDLTPDQRDNNGSIRYSTRSKIRNYKTWVATSAAVAIFALGIGIWQGQYISRNPEALAENTNSGRTLIVKENESISRPSFSIQDAKIDVAPARQTAQLILSDGQRIQIGGHNTGSRVDHQVGIDFTSQDYISYLPSATSLPKEYAHLTNTIVTPKGTTYTVLLSDGTKVMLNADSKLTFPLEFAGGSREVFLEGEAYFDVAKRSLVQSRTNKDKQVLHSEENAQPFIVRTAQSQIRVLGTRFNVNAYRDQPSDFTTLEEGSVEVVYRRDKNRQILIPGQQAYIAGEKLQIRPALLERDLAWKNGDFVFEKSSIIDIMNEIARWYDVKVEYLGPVGEERYISTISRGKTLKEVLEVLETTTNVRFNIRMQGAERRLMVVP